MRGLKKLIGAGILSSALLISPLFSTNSLARESRRGKNGIFAVVNPRDTLTKIIQDLDKKYGTDPVMCSQQAYGYAFDDGIYDFECGNSINPDNIKTGQRLLFMNPRLLNEIDPSYFPLEIRPPVEPRKRDIPRYSPRRELHKPKKEKGIDDSGFSLCAKLGGLMPSGNLVGEQYGGNLIGGIGCSLESPILGVGFSISYYSDTGDEYTERWEKRSLFNPKEYSCSDKEKFGITSFEADLRLKLNPGGNHAFPYLGIFYGRQLLTKAKEREEGWEGKKYDGSGSRRESENLSLPYWGGVVGIEKPVGGGLSFFVEAKGTKNMEDEKNGIKEGDLETLTLNAGVRVIF